MLYLVYHCPNMEVQILADISSCFTLFTNVPDFCFLFALNYIEDGTCFVVLSSYANPTHHGVAAPSAQGNHLQAYRTRIMEACKVQRIVVSLATRSLQPQQTAT